MKRKKLSHKKLCELLKYRGDGVFIRKKDASYSDKKGAIVHGSLRTDGYRHLSIERKRHFFHRIVFFYHHGYLPKYIDHINRNKSDNRIENLRAATCSLNGFNRKADTKNKSGVTGVIWRHEPRRWISFIGLGGKYVHLYCGKSKNAAIKKRKEAEKKYYAGS